MLDGWQRASCGCVPSLSGATTMAEAGVIEGNIVVDSGAVGMTLSIVAVTAGEAGAALWSQGVVASCLDGALLDRRRVAAFDRSLQ